MPSIYSGCDSTVPCRVKFRSSYSSLVIRNLHSSIDVWKEIYDNSPAAFRSYTNKSIYFPPKISTILETNGYTIHLELLSLLTWASQPNRDGAVWAFSNRPRMTMRLTIQDVAAKLEEKDDFNVRLIKQNSILSTTMLPAWSVYKAIIYFSVYLTK